MVVPGAPRQPGDFFVGIALLTALVIRSVIVYGPPLTDGRSWFAGLEPTHAVYVGVATMLLVGIVIIHGTHLTASVSNRMRHRPVAAGILGAAVLVGAAVSPRAVRWFVDALLAGAHSLDVTVVTAVTAVMLVLVLAVLTAIAIYAVVLLTLATVEGYLLVTAAATGRIGRHAVPVGAGMLAGVLLMIPGGLLVELALTAVVAGAALITWGSDILAVSHAGQRPGSPTVSGVTEASTDVSKERLSR